MYLRTYIEIWGHHNSYEERCFLVRDAVEFGRNVSTFGRNLLPPGSA